MKLPDICRTSVKTRVKYLSLIAYMARIDGQLDEKENALIYNMASRLGLSPEQRETTLKEVDYSDSQIEEILEELKKNKLQHSFILDLIAMAIADGMIKEQERLMLAQISSLIGLEHEEFHNLINFIQATTIMGGSGDIDPMCQYVIDMFFDWSRNKDVKLYKQTTFAINEKVDASLKNDL